MRKLSPFGASESENGCCVYQNPFGEEPPEEELAGLGAQPVEACARSCAARRRPAPRRITSVTRSPYRNVLIDRPGEAVPDDEHEREEVEGAPVVGGVHVRDQLVAVRDHVEPRERDAGVGGEVDRVPPLVARASAARRRARSRATTTRRNVPTVAVMIPGYGEVVGGAEVDARGSAASSRSSAAERPGRLRLRQRQPVPVLARTS